MAALNQNWLTEGWIDFEYKKYMLLAYLQETTQHFDEKKLYPRFSDLIEHYNSIKLFRDNKMAAASAFAKEISKLDFENMRTEYSPLFEDDEVSKELDAIADFALHEMEEKLGIGKELYEDVKDKLEVFPVGIQPLRTDEGYFFLSDFLKKLVNVYSYRISIFESMHEKYRGINVRFVHSYRVSISNTYENIKYQLLEKNSQLPNPATYAVEFKESFPLPETMLPVAKRSLVRYISVAK